MNKNNIIYKLIKEELENNNINISLKNKEVNHFKKSLEVINDITSKFNDIEIRLIGGAVRDLLYRKFIDDNSKKIINDLDFSIYKKSNKTLDKEKFEEIADYLSEKYDIDGSGLKFLHMAVYNDGYEVEFGAPRQEAYMDKSRKPVTKKGTIDDDIKRRDFTINAIPVKIVNVTNNSVEIYVENKYEKYVEQLKNQELDTPKENTEEVLKEDPLRLLRAIRFSGYGFNMSKKLKKSVEEFDIDILFDKVSLERIQEELVKILMKGNIEVFIETNFISRIINEFAEFNDKDFAIHELNHIKRVVESAREYASNRNDFMIMLLSALFHDIGKAKTGKYNKKKDKFVFYGHDDISKEVSQKILKYFKFPNKIIKKVGRIIEEHMKIKFIDDMKPKKLIKYILKNEDDIEQIAFFNKLDWRGKTLEFLEDNGLVGKEDEIYDKIMKYKKLIDDIKNEYKNELKEIGKKVGMNDKIPNEEKSKIVLGNKADFIYNKIKQYL